MELILRSTPYSVLSNTSGIQYSEFRPFHQNNHCIKMGYSGVDTRRFGFLFKLEGELSLIGVIRLQFSTVHSHSIGPGRDPAQPIPLQNEALSP
jgi:hypothetical protein